MFVWFPVTCLICWMYTFFCMLFCIFYVISTTYLYLYLFISISASLSIYLSIYLCKNTNTLLDFIAVFSDIYHEFWEQLFLHMTVNDCFFLCPETCVYVKIISLIWSGKWFRSCSKITSSSWQFAAINVEILGNKIDQSILIEIINLLFENKWLINVLPWHWHSAMGFVVLFNWNE